MVLAVVQARYSSSRLPGKVLKPIMGEPMLLRQLERVKRSERITRLVLATSTDSSDDAIADLCKSHGIDCFRGSLNDVLDRYYQAAVTYNPEHVVRLTGDCPLIDPVQIDRVIEHHLQGNFDYSSNSLEPTFPDGLDVEVFRMKVLAEAWKESSLPSHREHVTSFIYNLPERYRLGKYKHETDLSDLRWTVDEASDYELVDHIYRELFPGNPHFSMENILEYLTQNPKWKTHNKRFERNEGYQKSLRQDELFLAGKRKKD